MRWLTRNPTFRKVGIPVYRAGARQVRFFPGPRVLAMSMPKAGTHLLSRVLSLLPKMMFSGLHLSEEHVFNGPFGPATDERLALDLLNRTLDQCRDGQYLTGHFPHNPQLRTEIVERQFRMMLVLRDPRDVVVSHAHYVSSLKRHFHWPYYNQILKTKNDRIMASIQGFSPQNCPADLGLPSIGDQISGYLPWLDDPKVTVCSFEKLVGAAGGGTEEDQRQQVEKIARAVDRFRSNQDIERISERVFSQRSRTFRRGAIGDWVNHFNDEHKQAFKEIAGESLIKMGYAQDLDW